MATRKRKSRKSAHRALIYQHRKYYDALLELQGGGCAICGRPPTTRRLALDHDHRTMQVRGLLCFRCNSMLRTWVTLSWLTYAYDYLAAPPFEELDLERVEGDTT